MTAETFRPVTTSDPSPTSPTSSKSPTKSEAAGFGSSEPLHISGIDIPADPFPAPEIDGPLAAARDDVIPQELGGKDLVSPDQFFVGFRQLIGAPNVLRMLQKRQQLASLQIDPGDQAAREASDALYEICLEVSWLRWMITYEGKWVKRAIAIGGFGVGLAGSVMVELNAERQASRQAGPEKPAGETSTADAPKPAEPVPVDGAVL